MKKSRDFNTSAKKPPAVPELYGPYDNRRRPVPPHNLAKDTPYVFGAHTPHDKHGYGVRYEFDWGDSKHENFDFGWPDPGMPDPSHCWSSMGEKVVKVRARYYNPNDIDDCSPWSAWNFVRVTVKK